MKLIVFIHCIGLIQTKLLPSEPTRILKQPEYKVVVRGRSVVFECKVKHDPSLIPTMTWLKDDGELPDDERSELYRDVSLLKSLFLLPLH